MRQAMFAVALCTWVCPTPSTAQEGWGAGSLEGGSDPFGALLTHPGGFAFGFDGLPPAPQAPLVYGGCLVAEDGLTPLICAQGDGIKPPPEGFLWKDDPAASLSEPQHCLWWEEGGTFVGIPGRWLCRDGAAPSGGRPPESLRRPDPSDGDVAPTSPETQGETLF